MASTIIPATLTVTHSESITLNGKNQGVTNTMSIENVEKVSRRIIDVPTSEVVVLSMGTAAASGTFVEGDVRYIRITNLDDANFVYLVFKNEYNNEFCVKLDYAQSFIYNGDNVSGVIDTMLANQVAFGFTEATGDVTDESGNITNITATSRIIPGLRYAHDSVEFVTTLPETYGLVTESIRVGTVYGGDATDGYRGTSLQLVDPHPTTGGGYGISAEGTDTDGTATYSAGFGDLVEITAEADTGAVDLELFVASK